MQLGAIVHAVPDAYDRVRDAGPIDDAAVRNDRVINGRAVDFRGRQKAWPREYWRAHVEKVKARQFGGHIEARLKKGPDRSDVLPVPLEHVRVNAMGVDGLGNDMLAEIGEFILQQLDDDVAVE